MVREILPVLYCPYAFIFIGFKNTYLTSRRPFGLRATRFSMEENVTFVLTLVLANNIFVLDKVYFRYQQQNKRFHLGKVEFLRL